MKSRLDLIKALFLAYVFLMIVFNALILDSVLFPKFQIIFSLIWITIILAAVFNFSCKRSLVWWTLVLISALGIIRPLIEFMYTLSFPETLQSLFPPFTPLFSTIGVIIMIPAFILLLHPGVQKCFPES